MADISITDADVVQTAGQYESFVIAAGVTIASGDFVTLNANNELVLTDNDADATSTTYGIFMALSAGTAGQRITVAKPGSTITVGAVLANATPYYLSSTAGLMCLRSDLATSDRVVQVGYSKSTSSFFFNPINYGVTL